RDTLADGGLEGALPYEEQMKGPSGGGQATGCLDDHRVALHDPEARQESDDGLPGRQPQLTAQGGAVRARLESLSVGASRPGPDAILAHEARSYTLASDGFAHRDDQIRRVVVEPAVQGMRADRLDDVACADQRPPGPGHAVR